MGYVRLEIDREANISVDWWGLEDAFVGVTISTIIIRHDLGLDRPVSASSNSLFKCLPSRLRLFAL
jgi:hypothetical protein